MNFAVGVVVGALIGWLAFRFLGANAERGAAFSLIVGVAGGALGGHFAPMLNGTAVVEGQLNLFSLVVSAALAAGGVIVTNMIAGSRGP